MSPSAAVILVVDDEVQNRKLLQTQLRPEGYVTLTAASGEEALASIAQRAPDLILLDIMMPGIDGYRLAGILKKNPATANIPIIMVSALTDRGDRLAGLAAGAEEFLSKPIDRAELCLRVRNLLRLKALADLQHRNANLEHLVQARTAQLLAANQELEAFSYSVSHDLRAPLSTLQSFSKLLGTEIGAGSATARSHHYLDRIQAGALQMADLIDALLSLAQVSRAGLEFGTVDLSGLAQAVLAGCQEREPDAPARWNIQQGMFAQGDGLLLRQVLENLLGNAWKFSDRKAQREIAFDCECDADGRTVYAVRDNGAGFDMAHSVRLFTPFERLHPASTFPGTGIGLATVRRVVARHGGRVWADSVEGQGANFYFTLGDAAA